MKKTSKINWTNTLFLIFTPIIGIIGTIYLVIFQHVSWQTWVLTVVLSGLSGLAVTAGYHRLFAHCSYRVAWPIRLLFLLFASASFEGSVLEWCTDHRNHHRYTDTDRDPYNIKRGFWYAHIGWLLVLDGSKRDYSNVDDLKKDPIVRFQHRFFPYLGILIGFILPTMIAGLWGNALAGFIIAGALRITFNHHATFCINSVCHIFGKRTYSDKQSARDNWITAFFTYGEGFHNFHHQFPIDYRNGLRYFHYDPTKWLIRGMSYLGLAYDLKRVSTHRIIKYQIRMDEKHISLLEHMSSMLKPTYEKIQQLITRVEELEKNYEQLKKSKMQYMAGKMNDYREHVHEYRRKLKHAKQELKYFHSLWNKLTRQNTLNSPLLAS